MPIVLKFEDSNFCYIIVHHLNKNYEVFSGILDGEIINIKARVHINSVNKTNSKSMFMLDDGELDVEMGKNMYIPYIETDKQHISDVTLILNPINKKLKYVNSFSELDDINLVESDICDTHCT